MINDVISKAPAEQFDVRFEFVNRDPLQRYQIAGIQWVTMTREGDGGDMSQTMLEPTKNTFAGNMASAWIKNGVSGQSYTMTIQVIMATGQQLQKKVKINVV